MDTRPPTEKVKSPVTGETETQHKTDPTPKGGSSKPATKELMPDADNPSESGEESSAPDLDVRNEDELEAEASKAQKG
jgi:hypothetical protein